MKNCPNCKLEMEDSYMFCANCGTQLQIQNQETLDDQLIDAYIGKNIDLFKGKKFSFKIFFLCFFLNIYYALYRKFILFAAYYFITISLSSAFLIIIGFALFGIIMSPLTTEVNNQAFMLIFVLLLLIIILYILPCIFFRKLYMRTVKKNVASIKKAYPEANHEKLLEICRQKGGTSLKAVIIYIILGSLLNTLIPMIAGNISQKVVTYYSKKYNTELKERIQKYDDADNSISKNEAEAFLEDLVINPSNEILLLDKIVIDDEKIFINSIKYLINNNQYTKNNGTYTFKKSDIEDLARIYYMDSNYNYIPDDPNFSYDATTETFSSRLNFGVFSEGPTVLSRTAEIINYDIVDDNEIDFDYRITTVYDPDSMYDTYSVKNMDNTSKLTYAITLIRINDELRISYILEKATEDEDTLEDNTLIEDKNALEDDTFTEEEYQESIKELEQQSTLTYNISEDFIEDETNIKKQLKKIKKYFAHKNYPDCNILIEYRYNDANETIEDLISSTKLLEAHEKITGYTIHDELWSYGPFSTDINNQKWYYSYVRNEKDNIISYYYVTGDSDTDIVYLIKFDIIHDLGQKCESAYDTFIETLNLE